MCLPEYILLVYVCVDNTFWQQVHSSSVRRWQWALRLLLPLSWPMFALDCICIHSSQALYNSHFSISLPCSEVTIMVSVWDNKCRLLWPLELISSCLVCLDHGKTGMLNCLENQSPLLILNNEVKVKCYFTWQWADRCPMTPAMSFVKHGVSKGKSEDYVCGNQYCFTLLYSRFSEPGDI